jgi:uncharacterized protein YbbC (DUF1343 family)
LKVTPGVDVLLKKPRAYLGCDKVGLVTNPTGVTSLMESTFDVFYQNADINLVTVFGPEHGARGEVQDALDVASYIDKTTGLNVYSLYGDHRAPTREMLEGVDSLIFDIQDCGSRFYTYVSTLTLCMNSAKENGIKILVLDRPNPIKGNVIEGNILESDFESFIGLHPISIRHGMTIGELALFINESIKCDLEIVKMKHWQRELWYEETGLSWVQPSPNMPTVDTAVVFPGICFFEGVNVSEGRGTTKPFEYLGAPWIDNRVWIDSLNQADLPGVLFRKCYFKPTFWRFRDEVCSGVQVHVIDRDKYNAVRTGLYLLSTLIETHPKESKFNEPSYDKRRHFDLLAGTDKLRNQLIQGLQVDDIIASWEKDVNKFQSDRDRCLLYE